MRSPYNGRKLCGLFPCNVEIPDDKEYCAACTWVLEKNIYEAKEEQRTTPFTE